MTYCRQGIIDDTLLRLLFTHWWRIFVQNLATTRLLSQVASVAYSGKMTDLSDLGRLAPLSGPAKDGFREGQTIPLWLLLSHLFVWRKPLYSL